MSILIRLKNIQKFYAERQILDLNELKIEQGELIGISGPNGCGKSTLLRILSLLDQDYLGEYYFEEKLAKTNNIELKRQITLLLQEPYLLASSVYNNVKYGLKVRNIDPKLIHERICEAMQMLGLDLDKFAKRRRYELSGGEKQRVALAARLVLKPKLLILDEPTANVDMQSAELIREAILKLNENGATIIVVSHDMPWLSSLGKIKIINLEDLQSPSLS